MTRRSGASTRDSIQAAAARLFRERGFAGTSVRDIAATADTDPALVIRHFGSKELLFLDTTWAPAPNSSVPTRDGSPSWATAPVATSPRSAP